MKSIADVKVIFDIDKFEYFMKENKLTRKKLSEITGIDKSTIHNYACGYRVPVSGSLYKIAIVLNVAMEDLLKEI